MGKKRIDEMISRLNSGWGKPDRGSWDTALAVELKLLKGILLEMTSRIQLLELEILMLKITPNVIDDFP
jgi:hypothetical protein